MLEIDIIESAVGPSTWINPIGLVPKSNSSVRLCVNKREANKVIKRERHVMPTLDDITAALGRQFSAK